MSVPTYAYGLNNPLRFTDPTGLWALILYGDPLIAGRNFGAEKPDIASAIEHYALPLTRERDTSTIVSYDLTSKTDPGAFAVAPDGSPYDTVIYFGHAGPENLRPRGSVYPMSASEFLALFGKGAPRNLHIIGCQAGGKSAPFRSSIDKAWPTTDGYDREIQFVWKIPGSRSVGDLTIGGRISGVDVW